MPENDHDGFENLVDELPMGIVSCDRKGNITAINDFLLKILGSPSVETTKKFNMLTLPPIVESGVAEILEEALTTGKSASIETPYRSIWGKELILNFKAFPRTDENGLIYGCNAIIEDVTAKRRVDVEIEENKRKDNLISHISNRFINSNFKEIDEDVNKALEDLGDFIGADRVCLFKINKSTGHIIKTHEWHDTDVTSSIPFNEKWETGKKAIEYVANLQIVNISNIEKVPDECRDLQKIIQSLGITSIALVPLSNHGVFSGFISVDSKRERHNWKEKDLYVLKIIGNMMASILERKDTDDMLLKKEQEYEKVIDSVDSVIWKATFDNNGNTLETNLLNPVDNIMDMPDGTIGNDWDTYFEHIHPDDIPNVHETFKRSFAHPDTPIDLDYRLVTNDGRIVWANTIGSSTLQSDGTFLSIGTTVNITPRKLAEEKLRESEEKLRLLIEHAPASLAMLDRNMRHIAVSQRWLDMFFLEDQDIIGKSHYDVFPEICDEWKEMHRRALKGEVIPVEETRFERVDGRVQWVQGEVRPWKAADGTIGGIIIFSEDVTERKEAVQELERNEEKYRTLFEQSNDAIFRTTLEGQVVEVNNKACEMLGHSKEKLQKMHINDFRILENDEMEPILYDRLKTVGRTGQNEKFITANENIIDVEVRVQVFKAYPNLAQAVVRDITERRRAEVEIIRSENKYRSLFEKSSDVVIIHEFNGQILDVNNRACDILGYSKEELKNYCLMDFIHPNDRERVTGAFNELASKGMSRNESRMIRGDGKIIYMDITSSVIHDNRIQAVARDTTDRVKAEVAMFSAKIEAETASRTKSEFLANMSHELRTPLNSIIGFSDAMLEGIAGELDPNHKHYLNHISNSGHHLLTLINDILDISKIEAGKMELFFELLNVRSAVNEVVNLTEPLRARKEIVINIDVPESIPHVIADKSKFKQIMYNLLGNSIKFTHKGGKVSIHAELNDPMIRISVIDTGIGISKENQGKLFRPFIQIDSSISRKYGGTGLGLALVKELVDLHGGSIWVESEPGKGSKFTFEIPIDQK